jgi:hypothetical protein
MCIFPSVPKPTPAPVIPQRPDANEARVSELKRRANLKGFTSTISPGTLLGTSLVNPMKDANATGAPKSMLGA